MYASKARSKALNLNMEIFLKQQDPISYISFKTQIQLHFFISIINTCIMKKTNSNYAHPPTMQNVPSGYIRPVQPNIPPLTTQNQYMPMRTLQTSADQLVEQQKHIQKQFKSDALDKLAKADYQPAKYQKSLLYKNQRSYKKKIDNQYRQLDLFCDTNELRYFGLGTYFYIQFFRRMMWLFFVLTLLNGASIYINFKGKGLNNYSVSFSSYLIKTTLGNYSGQALSVYDAYIIALVPALNFLALLLFFWIWKVHLLRAIVAQEQDNKDVKPEKFCLEIEGLPQSYLRQGELLKFFTTFGPVYEVSINRYYDNKLSYFEEIDQLQEQIKEQELQLALDGDSSNRKSIQEKRLKLKKLQQKLNQISIKPQTISAFVHFQFQKSKIECLSHFNEHYLFNTCSHNFMRCCCCCCVRQPDSKLIFNEKTLMIRNSCPPPPEDINWVSFQIGICNKIFRVLFAALVILVFLAVSCTIIGLCSIYIQSHSSNCDGIDTSSYNVNTVTATGNTTILKCFCNANLVSSFTDSAVQTTCSDYLKDIYVQQTIQYVVIITSSVTNILFALISEKLINFVRPSSFSATLKYKTAILTLFFTLNSLLIPILIYANIFGFTPSSYVSFLTVISSGIRSFLKVENLSFYANFTAIWYRNVSPIFTNYILFNTVGLWGSYIFFKCCCSSKDSLKDQQNRVLQKTMNRKMTDFTLEVAKEAASLYLIIIMACIFWAGIPVLVPLAFLNIMSRYIINRSLLQNHSVRIAGLGQEFSQFTLFILPVILILLPPMAEWMIVANSYIYPSGLPLNFSLSFLQGYSSVLDVQLYLPFYLGISALALAQTVIYYTVIRCCSSLCSLCYQKKQTNFHTRPFVEYTKSLNILCSYNLRSNDHLRNTILHLQKYLVQYDSK